MVTSGPVKDVSAFLTSKQQQFASDEALLKEWNDIEEMYNKKLWHQLTLKLLNIVKYPSLQKNEELLSLYNNFIQIIETRINPLALVEMLVEVVKQFKDPKEAIALLEATETKVKHKQEAVILCQILEGQIKLEKLNDQEATLKQIEEIDKLMNELDGVTSVHARYYLLASQVYRLQGKFAEYYQSALKYLGCIELSDLSAKEQVQHGFLLGLAALLGESIYNLGELLAHPILDSLKSTPNWWLVELLYAFNAGDIAKFEKMKPKWSSIPDIATQEIKLRQKISLLCLMEMAFKKPSNNRRLTFNEIAAESKLPLSDVEHLVMKALSLGLIKGSIDQVASIVNITWVQPRVLDKSQLANMIQRLDVWCKDVKSMEHLMENKAQDILTL
ncbi:unnamed protein product [Bemisia tabaci]|uniref:26S proteasome non-ATPase regulatory subunit 13 n=1 Tax=Bemisia tabaci TaxID=7038 RepID=A0A9P0AGE1_BEMTA|nr:PREDICTED: 26S proteasome non-ATPase regulatory subunit 13 [Bemisia tabaci]CAH0390189.1 unnamed protein product [Bemisia tabaci]